jgi:hypothetical protein
MPTQKPQTQTHSTEHKTQKKTQDNEYEVDKSATYQDQDQSIPKERRQANS